MKNCLTSLLVGVLFGIGLSVSGMTNPQKVISFLDFTGHWDPSLAFVMVGAIGVHMIAYRIMAKQKSPFFASEFLVPKRSDINLKLLLGSGIFGIGWGLSGYCPGPAVTSLFTLHSNVIVFVASMLLGMFVFSKIKILQK